MTVFSGDSPLELFQAATKNVINCSNAKFARKDESICVKQTRGSYPNHADISESLKIKPMEATDLGEIGISYNTFTEPPCLTVAVMGRSKNFAINASDETRIETGAMMEPYFKKYLPEFIKFVGLKTVDFSFICKPFGSNI